MKYEVLLSQMLSDMEKADPLYRPTNFWQSGLASIIDDLKRRGFANFREHPSAHFFYVPTYRRNDLARASKMLSPALKALDMARPGRRLAERFQRLAKGELAAFTDYRLFKAADTPSGLAIDGTSESENGGGERFVFEGVRVSQSLLNYLRGLAFLKKHADTSNVSSILEIGGGYGTLGEILLKARSDAFYLNVDIPPVAAVSTYYLQKLLGVDQVFTYAQVGNGDIDVDKIKQKNYRAAVICPWQLPDLRGTFDVFANFISFQEMEPHVVKNYANIVQPITSQFVLLRNSAAGKDVAAKEGCVGVMQPITTDEMISFFDKFRLLGRDSLGCGNRALGSNFRSEVICMARR